MGVKAVKGYETIKGRRGEDVTMRALRATPILPGR
jgi:hypothetical protein